MKGEKPSSTHINTDPVLQTIQLTIIHQEASMKPTDTSEIMDLLHNSSSIMVQICTPEGMKTHALL